MIAESQPMSCGCGAVYGVLASPLEVLVFPSSEACPHRHRNGDTIPVQTHRVIVTGSRKWADHALIVADLEYQLAYAQSVRAVLVVVHGANPRGADAAASAWAKAAAHRGVVEEDVPADWERDCDAHCRHKPRTRDGRNWCPVAGVLRNQILVDRGAALCLAYPLDGTGTQDCMRRADKAHIPVFDRSSV